MKGFEYIRAIEPSPADEAAQLEPIIRARDPVADPELEELITVALQSCEDDSLACPTMQRHLYANLPLLSSPSLTNTIVLPPPNMAPVEPSGLGVMAVVLALVAILALSVFVVAH